MATTNNGDDTFRAAFDGVIQEFRSKLNNDALYKEILQTKSIEEVYTVTDRLQEEQARTGRLRHMSKITPFLEGLNSYASVIEVFMQAKPDVLALIWGPIKLLLQWADVLKQSMDAIIDTTDEIGARLPEFRQSTRMFGKNKLISDVLVLFFRDVMDFYIVALKFFSSPRLKLVFEALWPRQREKIKIVVKSIERHTLLLRDEVRLEHIQAEYDFRQQALEHFEKSEAAQLRQEYYSLRTSISPRTYQETLAYLDDCTCHEAGLWLTKYNAFCDWLETTNTTTSILWLQGIPGSGKTYLARVAVHEARRQGHSLFVFLSYAFSSSVSTLSILHSLIFQLTADDSNLQSIVCHASGEDFRRNVNVVQDVFRALVCSAGPVYVFLDGLDEIDGSTRSRILSILLQLSTELNTLRVMISCRPEADITSLLSDKCSTIQVNEQNSGGLKSYISRRTLRWYKEREFYPEARKEMEALLAPLAAKSKGMFLYAKVVLDSIEFLDPDEIMADLQVLPETMNDAYGRILERINSIASPIARAKARTIIGWIGVSPTPLTVQELEQALVVHAQGVNGTGKVSSKLSIVQLCGPIVEVVNDHVQYVHFTVYEYFLSPQISNSIDPQESRVNLAACCITYLCQPHHETTIDDETRSTLVLDGAYRFHYYSSSFWLKLLEDTLCGGPGFLSKELVDLLKILYDTRGNNAPGANRKRHEKTEFHFLKKTSPELYARIEETASFIVTCSQSGFEYRKNQDWTKLDPMQISRTSCYIYEQIEEFLSASKDNEIAQRLQRHYGRRLYKCAFVDCTFKRHGFESNALRRSHEKSHTKPWKCSFTDCEFYKGGFLSRRMRDDHLDHFHVQKKPETGDLVLISDEEELKNLYLDLIRADDVAGMRALATSYKFKNKGDAREFFKRAGQCMSPEMLLVLDGRYEFSHSISGDAWSKLTSFTIPILHGVTNNNNNKRLFEYVLTTSMETLGPILGTDYMDYVRPMLHKVMGKGNHEMLEVMCRWIEQDILKGTKRAYLVSPAMISATTDDMYREQILLSLWRKVPKRVWDSANWKNALPNVACTTCSTRLAEYLLEQNVPVDWRVGGEKHSTALLHASRKTSAAAANLVKLLLFKGANTTVQMERLGEDGTSRGVKVDVSKEKGAQQISKWLGAPWDELVAQAERARQHPADPTPRPDPDTADSRSSP